MPYYEVELRSASFCGFEETRHFKAKNKEELFNSYDFKDFEEYMRDWIDGSVNYEIDPLEAEEDYLELEYRIDEITQKEVK